MTMYNPQGFVYNYDIALYSVSSAFRIRKYSSYLLQKFNWNRYVKNMMVTFVGYAGILRIVCIMSYTRYNYLFIAAYIMTVFL